VKEPAAVRVRLPATSANLGSAFDVAAVALDLHLEVTAQKAAQFSIHATGRNTSECSRPDGNLILATYAHVLQDARLPVPPLALRVHNEIPLGMGCGSSAAARLAGLLLARMIGGLPWSDEDLLAWATAREGHPDNVAACWRGGLAVSAVERCSALAASPAPIAMATVPVPAGWSAAVLLPRHPVLTEVSRDVLPKHYERAAVVATLQRCGLLIAAFATGSGALLRCAMDDRMHQPYRRALCPLLDHAEALSRIPGVLGVALSGAGPALLLVLDQKASRDVLEKRAGQLSDAADLELLFCDFDRRGAQVDPTPEAVLQGGSARPVLPER
jgi:homoserine kinase